MLRIEHLTKVCGEKKAGDDLNLHTLLGNNTGIGISLGMLVGLAIGMCIHKKTEDAEK